MSGRIPKVSQRETVSLIPQRKPFDASSLTGRVVNGLGAWDSGQLYGDDLAVFREDMLRIRYVVYSYATPIAWYTEGYGWYKVKGKFSMTTSTKHQSRLYMIPDPR